MEQHKKFICKACLNNFITNKSLKNHLAYHKKCRTFNSTKNSENVNNKSSHGHSTSFWCENCLLPFKSQRSFQKHTRFNCNRTGIFSFTFLNLIGYWGLLDFFPPIPSFPRCFQRGRRF